MALLTSEDNDSIYFRFLFDTFVYFEGTKRKEMLKCVLEESILTSATVWKVWRRKRQFSVDISCRHICIGVFKAKYRKLWFIYLSYSSCRIRQFSFINLNYESEIVGYFIYWLFYYLYFTKINVLIFSIRSSFRNKFRYVFIGKLLSDAWVFINIFFTIDFSYT